MDAANQANDTFNTLVKGNIITSSTSAHREQRIDESLRYEDADEVLLTAEDLDGRQFELRFSDDLNDLYTLLQYLSRVCHRLAQYDCVPVAINIVLSQSVFRTMSEYLLGSSLSRNRPWKEQRQQWIECGTVAEPHYETFRFTACIDNFLYTCKLKLALACKNPEEVQRLISNGFTDIGGRGSTRFVAIGCILSYGSSDMGLLSHHAFALVLLPDGRVAIVNGQEKHLDDKIRLWNASSQAAGSVRAVTYLTSYSSVYVYQVHLVAKIGGPVMDPDEFEALAKKREYVAQIDASFLSGEGTNTAHTELRNKGGSMAGESS